MCLTQQNTLSLSLLVTLLFFLNCESKKDETSTRPPNIIFILADDLGYGDLSCYGQEKFQTPNIDQLAKEGLLFTQHYSGNTVCAPSRSALMTAQTTGHTPIRGNKEWPVEGQWPLPDSAFTMAEMFKEAGYITGAFGKWGLGYPGSEGDPNMQGFDTFYGYNCQRLGHHYYPYHLWDNQEKVILEENAGQRTGAYGPELIHEKAISFMDENKEKPFFLFYPSVIPHAELFAKESYMRQFRGKFDPEKSYEGVDEGDGYKDGAYGSQPESHAAFAAMITHLDDQVGEIVSHIKTLGLDKNTIIIFTSDNGPHMEGGADPDYFDSNGPLKGYKRDLYEGGIRVPTIAWGPGFVKTGKTDHVSAFWDFLPTFAEMIGSEVPTGIDGVSLLPTLQGEAGQKQHEYLYWEFHEKGGRLAIRKDNWKYIHYNVFDSSKMTTELYDLSKDIGETNNLADENPEMVEELEQLMQSARVPSEIFNFQSTTYMR